MHWFGRVLVGDNERVLLIRKKRFADVLGPGEYWIFTLGRNVELERHNVKGLTFSSDWADYLVQGAARAGVAVLHSRRDTRWPVSRRVPGW